jgi:hypothetical protein
MNMLLPFLLDADTRRIDAAGEQSGVLRAWMLSGRDEPQPRGYLGNRAATASSTTGAITRIFSKKNKTQLFVFKNSGGDRAGDLSVYPDGNRWHDHVRKRGRAAAGCGGIFVDQCKAKHQCSG